MIVPILISYAYRHALNEKGRASIRSMSEIEGVDLRLILDSGAFTHFTKGTVVDFDGYCDWLWDVLEFSAEVGFTCEYVALDVVGDQLATHRNYKRMVDEKHLEQTMPVFTRGGSIALLKGYLKGRRRVALGGLGVADNTVARFLRDLYRDCPALTTYKSKVHWFGYTDREFMAAFQPGSVDSNTATLSPQRFKHFSMFTSSGILHRGVVKGHFNDDLKRRHKLRLYCERNGIDYEKLCTDDSTWVGDDAINTIVSIASHIKYVQKLARRLGTVNYMAIGSAPQLPIVEKSILSIRRQG